MGREEQEPGVGFQGSRLRQNLLNPKSVLTEGLDPLGAKLGQVQAHTLRAGAASEGTRCIL